MEVASYDLNSFHGSLLNINSLPDEVLLQIFKNLESQESFRKNLKSITRVEKRWYTVANETQTSIALSGFKASRVEGIVRRFKNLSTINLSLLYDCTDDVLFQIGMHCPNLREIHISDSYKQTSGGRGLAALAKGCPRLRTLSIHGYSGPDAPLMAIGDNCPDLVQLRLRSSPSMTDRVIVNVARRCKKIEELDISFTDITDASLEAIGKGMPRLQHLDMKHCKAVTGAGIVHLAKGCPSLKILHLGVVEVGDKGLMAIGEHSPDLEELYLDYGWGKWGKLSKDSIEGVAKGCPKLKVLSLRGSKQVDDKVLQGLVRGCPSLTTLDLHACAGVGDDSLEAIVKGCKQLQTLVLSGTSVGASGASAINAYLPKLSTLRLNGDLISDGLLESLGKYCQNLSDLYLANCGQVSDSGLEHVIKGCKGLKSLTAKCSPRVSGTSFSVPCPNLKTVNMQGSAVVDEGLALMAKNCSEVASLSLQGCTKLSAEAIVSAVQGKYTLKELNLVGCTQLSRDQILSVLRAAYGLKSARVSRPGSPQDEYTINKRHGGWNLPSWARSPSPTRLQLG